LSGRIGQGATALLIAQGMLGLTWTAPKLLYLPVVLLSGAAVFVALFVLGTTLCFWTVQTTEVTNIFTNGGTEMVSYPMDIYEEWFRLFFTFVVPLAFVTYFPALYFLGRPDGLGLPGYFPFLPPVVAVAFLAVARAAWTFGVRHYQSTGS
jgi:ABC-2 type transport system permease protein